MNAKAPRRQGEIHGWGSINIVCFVCCFLYFVCGAGGAGAGGERGGALDGGSVRTHRGVIAGALTLVKRRLISILTTLAAIPVGWGHSAGVFFHWPCVYL
jgi:hypothetical protein